MAAINRAVIVNPVCFAMIASSLCNSAGRRIVVCSRSICSPPPLLSLKANFYLSSVAKRYSNDIPVKNVSRIFIASGNVNANFPLILSLVLLSVFPITRLMSDIETPYLTISALKFLVTISPPSTLRGGFYCYITTFNGGSQEVFPPLKEIFFLICIKRYAILLIERGCA